MPPIPDPKVRLLFSAPLAAMAAALARTPEGQETGLASAVPRILAATFACAAIAYVASSTDADRRGPLGLVSGIAMTAGAAMSLSFAAGLGAALAFAGTFDLMVGMACAFALLLVAAATFILAYVISTLMAVRVRTAAIVMAAQIVPLTALICGPQRLAAYAVAAAAALVAGHAILRLRAAEKK